MLLLLTMIGACFAEYYEVLEAQQCNPPDCEPINGEPQKFYTTCAHKISFMVVGGNAVISYGDDKCGGEEIGYNYLNVGSTFYYPTEENESIQQLYRVISINTMETPKETVRYQESEGTVTAYHTNTSYHVEEDNYICHLNGMMGEYNGLLINSLCSNENCENCLPGEQVTGEKMQPEQVIATDTSISSYYDLNTCENGKEGNGFINRYLEEGKDYNGNKTVQSNCILSTIQNDEVSNE